MPAHGLDIPVTQHPAYLVVINKQPHEQPSSM
jgi:hypothetical protein